MQRYHHWNSSKDAGPSCLSTNSAHLRHDHLFPWNSFVLLACRFGLFRGLPVARDEWSHARWGCFIAGMSFACLAPPHHAHHVTHLACKCNVSDGFGRFFFLGFWLGPKVWVKQTKRVTSWMISLELSRWNSRSHEHFVRWSSDAWRIVRILVASASLRCREISKSHPLQSCLGCVSVFHR